MLRQLWDDVGDFVLIENNEVTPEWGCNPFSSDYILFNDSGIVVASLMLAFGVNGPLILEPHAISRSVSTNVLDLL